MSAGGKSDCPQTREKSAMVAEVAVRDNAVTTMKRSKVCYDCITSSVTYCSNDMRDCNAETAIASALCLVLVMKK
ncbi:MAG: hypothetical protein Q9169_007091 [Polycauliona sp. 2 TL-2023]